MIRRIAWLAVMTLMACLIPVYAQYSTVSCQHGETGTCRQATSCSQTNVQAAITASASGTSGYVSPTSFNGDGVYIPAGSCSWTSSVSWSNKNINVIGAGATSTVITPTGDAFDVAISGSWTSLNSTAAAFRISGIGFTGSPSGSTININGTSVSGPSGFFRVDNITVNYTATGNIVYVQGPVWGLLDHWNVTWAGKNFLEQADYLSTECVVSPGNTLVYLGEYSGRTLPIALGTENAVYVEASTFTFVGAAYTAAITDSESGGQRMVFRYNSVTGATDHYAHWSRGGNGGYCYNGQWDGHKYEIYNNTYNGQSSSGYPMRFGSGTGVIFNNTITGYSDPTVHVDETRGCGGESTNATMNSCDGTQAVDGNAGDTNAPGWPCAGQIGTACIAGNCTRTTMNSVPLLVWNNGAQSGCSSGGSCTNSVTVNTDGPMGSSNSCNRTMTNYIKATAHSVAGSLNGAIDYCQGSTMPTTCGIYTNSYAAYTYPHPLQGGGAPPPVPTGLTTVTNP